jgi:hypothetical protein
MAFMSLRVLDDSQVMGPAVGTVVRVLIVTRVSRRQNMRPTTTIVELVLWICIFHLSSLNLFSGRLHLPDKVGIILILSTSKRIAEGAQDVPVTDQSIPLVGLEKGIIIGAGCTRIKWNAQIKVKVCDI